MVEKGCVERMQVKSCDSRKKVFTVFLLIFPAFAPYASVIPSVSFGELLMFFLMAYLIIRGPSVLREVPKNPFWVYLIYAAVITLISSWILTFQSENYQVFDAVQRMLRDAFYFCIIMIFGAHYFDFCYAKKAMRVVSVILVCYMLIQFIVYGIAHFYIPGILPQLKTTANGGVTGAELGAVFLRTAESTGYLRAHGFFSEPAVCAQYLSMALILELFPEKGPINYLYVILYSAAIIVTFSVNGYVAFAAIWAIWALYGNKDYHNFEFKKLLFILAMIAACILVMQNPRTARVVDRLTAVLLGGDVTQSSILRLLRGIMFYFEMPSLFQIFGIGFGNFIQVKELYEITTAYEIATEYMNTDAYILISTGVIGFALFAFSLLLNVKNKGVIARMTLFLLLLLGLSSSIYSTPQFVIYLMFIMYAPEREKTW